MSDASIDELFDKYKRTDFEVAGYELVSLLEILDHPDLTWKIMLELLKRDVLDVHSELVAVRFHVGLKVPFHHIQDPVKQDPNHWKAILESRGINPSNKISLDAR